MLEADLVVPTSNQHLSDIQLQGWVWLMPTLRIKATLGAPLGFQEPFPSTPTVPNQPTI